MTMSGGWGFSPWGAGPWGGGGGGGAIAQVGAAAHRENVFRVEFSVPVYFSGILDFEDASHPTKWRIVPVVGSAGLDGDPVRPLLVTQVRLATEEDGVAIGDVGRFIDVLTDRPMTSFPALYTVEHRDIFAADKASSSSTGAQVPAVYREITAPTLDMQTPSRDIANAQTFSAAQASLPDPFDPIVLGTIQVDDTGDYAFDEGSVNLRKRVLRRVMTVKNAFAHLPGYGVGLPSYGKKLGTPTVVATIATEAETQIAQEPDVANVRVRTVVDPNVPNLLRVQVLVRPREGKAQRIDVPFKF